jgi:G3E family GTPase
MLADRLLLTKPDLAEDEEGLQRALRALNPAAPQRQAAHGAVAPDWLFAPAFRPAELPDWAAHHTAGLASTVIEREEPIPALALTLWMQGLAEHAGPRLLRLKGLVSLAEQPQRPAVLHAIQHMVHPLEWLDRWPTEDHRSRIVLIGEGIPRHFPARLLVAIEAEVAEETARRA